MISLMYFYSVPECVRIPRYLYFSFFSVYDFLDFFSLFRPHCFSLFLCVKSFKQFGIALFKFLLLFIFVFHIYSFCFIFLSFPLFSRVWTLISPYGYVLLIYLDLNMGMTFLCFILKCLFPPYDSTSFPAALQPHLLISPLHSI